VEKLTTDMENEVLKYFEQIESLGGVIPAIETGFFQKEIADASARYQFEVDTRDRIIVGVNEYVSEEKPDIPILQFDPEGEKRHLARLKKHKAERDAAAHAAAMTALEQASRDPRANTMPYIIAAVSAGATVGEVCNMWRKVYGEYREQVIV
ncbi:MAG: methylmalonyl-CoA mutase, partial [Dehalococcoidia bacterium]|nr:methylmalonyl-CoA mutase [Dehalococcoidia bacterium]